MRTANRLIRDSPPSFWTVFVFISIPFIFLYLIGLLPFVQIWIFSGILTHFVTMLYKIEDSERYPYRTRKEFNREIVWANKKWYGFLCDPYMKSNPSNYQMKFYCSAEQKEIETPLSATLIALTNSGFVFEESLVGWRAIQVFDSKINDFEGSYLTFKMLTKRVQAAYFNWKGIEYPAGCALYLEDFGIENEITEQDREVFFEFVKDRQFAEAVKKLQNFPKILNFQESDLKVLYAIRSPVLNDFVIFALNSTNGLIEQFIFNTNRFGFEKVSTEIQYDESMKLEDGKRKLLFMTYDTSHGFNTLTVNRNENGGIEKKILNPEKGRFELLPEKPIISRQKAEDRTTVPEDLNQFDLDDEQWENEFEIVPAPGEIEE